MVKKPTLTDVSSGYTSQTTLNNNFTALRDAFDNTLSRDGSTPNQMEADLDMNSNDILNAKDGEFTGTLTVAGVDINDIIAGVGPGTVFNTTNRFDGDGVATDFTLTKNPVSRANTQVYINGVYQQKNTYTVSGTTLSFTEAPPVGTGNIEVNIQESTDAGTLTADSVSTSDGEDVQAKLDQAHYTSRAAFIADINAGKKWADGDVVSDGTVSYIKSTGATDIPDMLGWLPFGDVYPDHFAENAIPGTTDMAAAVVAAIAYADVVHFKPVRYFIADTTAISIPDGKSLRGSGWTSGYGGGSSSGSLILIGKVTAGNVFEVSGTSSAFADRARVSISDIGFQTESSQLLTNLTGIVVNLFAMTNTFECEFHNVLFNDLNVHNVVVDNGGGNNAAFFRDCHVTSIGDARSGFSGITGQFTYGNGLNLTNFADSEIHSCFIELCGGTGYSIGSNSKALNVWCELCNRGANLHSDNAKIIGGSLRLHQGNGAYAQTNAKDWAIIGTEVKGNNYANAVGTAEGTFAVRLTSGNTGWTISDVDARDEILAAHPSKTVLQNFIHLGSSGNSGSIDAQIGDTATSGVNFYDPNGVLAAGLVSLNVRRTGVTNNTDGISVETAGMYSEVSGTVSGGASTSAVTTGALSAVDGMVVSRSSGTLFAAPYAAIGPKIVSQTQPTTLVDKTGAGNTGAVSMAGWASPVPYVHTGGGASEQNVVAALPNRILGDIQITFGDGSTNSFFFAARIKWDGTTLTTIDSVATNSGIGSISLSSSAGNLVLNTTTSTAQNANMVVNFDGVWMVSA